MPKINIPKAKQLPSGSWRSQYYINGKRMSFTADTEEGAIKKALLYRMTETPDDKKSELLSTLTVSDAVKGYIDLREGVLSESTIRNYRQMLASRFQSVMDRKLSDSINWQRVINDECKFVSPKTVRNAWGLVKTALDDYGVPYAAPALPAVQKKDIKFLSPSQIKEFVDVIHGDRYELPYLLCLHGLRRSEMLALKPDNIRNGRIYVRGALVKNQYDKFVFKETNKTQNSRRSVPVLLERVTELVSDVTTEYLCPFSPDGMNKHLYTITKNNGLPAIHFHSLRHSFASLCYHLGLSEMECMRLGGWSDFKTMRNIYTHLAEEDITEGELKLKHFFD